jgi:hypothetical protein
VPADLAQVTILAREAEHRAKNVLATVRPSQSDTPKGLKQAIERRIQGLANVHTLLVQLRWTGAPQLDGAYAEPWVPPTRQVVQTSIKTNDGGVAPVPLAPDCVWCSFCQAGHCIPPNQAFIVGAPATAP